MIFLVECKPLDRIFLEKNLPNSEKFMLKIFFCTKMKRNFKMYLQKIQICDKLIGRKFKRIIKFRGVARNFQQLNIGVWLSLVATSRSADGVRYSDCELRSKRSNTTVNAE